MSDAFDRAAKSFREAMLDWTRRHRPDYAIIARTAWDEEWDPAQGRKQSVTSIVAPAPFAGLFDASHVHNFLEALSRDPAFLEAGKR